MKVKIEFETKDKNNEFYHVYKKEGFLSGWDYVGRFKTIEDAYEWSLSRNEKVTFKGLYNRGRRSTVLNDYPNRL